MRDVCCCYINNGRLYVDDLQDESTRIFVIFCLPHQSEARPEIMREARV